VGPVGVERFPHSTTTILPGYFVSRNAEKQYNHVYTGNAHRKKTSPLPSLTVCANPSDEFVRKPWIRRIRGSSGLYLELKTDSGFPRTNNSV